MLVSNGGPDKVWTNSGVCPDFVLCPEFGQCMSYLCPAFVLVLCSSKICPVNPTFVLFKSSFCPQIHLLSNTCLHFFGIIPQKCERQTLDNFLTSSLYHLQPGYPAFGQNLDKLRILVFHETEWSWTKIGLQNPEFVQEPSKKSWIISIFRQVRLG